MAVGPSSCCFSSTALGQCVFPWTGVTKSVASVFLIANGISFAIITAVLTTITGSSLADMACLVAGFCLLYVPFEL
ncbi:hypothetical protein V8E55_001605 [Tylopilus felleus]